MHGTRICENNEFFSGFLFIKKAIDFLFDLRILAIRLFICITKDENDFISVILKSILEFRRNIRYTLYINRKKSINIAPHIQF